MKRATLFMLITVIELIVFSTFIYENGVLAMNEIQNDISKVLINEQEVDFDTPLPIINDRVLVPAWKH